MILSFLLALANAFPSDADTAPTPRWTAHFQQTLITQGDGGFHADYSGPNSLDADGGQATSLTSTLFLGARLWDGGEAYWNPEVNGGEGLDGSAGVAGFLNGETSHVTTVAPGWKPVPVRVMVKFPVGMGLGLTERMTGPAGSMLT